MREVVGHIYRIRLPQVSGERRTSSATCRSSSFVMHGGISALRPEEIVATRNGAPVDDVIHGGNAALRAELVASNSDCGCTLACRRLCDEQFRLDEHVVGHDGVGHLTRGLRLEQAGLHRTAVFLVPVLALEDVEQLGGCCRQLC